MSWQDRMLRIRKYFFRKAGITLFSTIAFFEGTPKILYSPFRLRIGTFRIIDFLLPFLAEEEGFAKKNRVGLLVSHWEDGAMARVVLACTT